MWLNMSIAKSISGHFKYSKSLWMIFTPEVHAHWSLKRTFRESVINLGWCGEVCVCVWYNSPLIRRPVVAYEVLLMLKTIRPLRRWRFAFYHSQKVIFRWSWRERLDPFLTVRILWQAETPLKPGLTKKHAKKPFSTAELSSSDFECEMYIHCRPTSYNTYTVHVACDDVITCMYIGISLISKMVEWCVMIYVSKITVP